jgi:hypothetical protein
VTLADDSGRSLLGTLGNGVNNELLDTQQMRSGLLEINTNPRIGRTEFNTSLFAPETPSQSENAARGFVYGPGIENFDMRIGKTVPVAESEIVRYPG